MMLAWEDHKSKPGALGSMEGDSSGGRRTQEYRLINELPNLEDGAAGDLPAFHYSN